MGDKSNSKGEKEKEKLEKVKTKFDEFNLGLITFPSCLAKVLSAKRYKLYLSLITPPLLLTTRFVLFLTFNI